jgi:hypothetical protein
MQPIGKVQLEHYFLWSLTTASLTLVNDLPLLFTNKDAGRGTGFTKSSIRVAIYSWWIRISARRYVLTMPRDLPWWKTLGRQSLTLPSQWGTNIPPRRNTNSSWINRYTPIDYHTYQRRCLPHDSIYLPRSRWCCPAYVGTLISILWQVQHRSRGKIYST